MGNTTFSIDLNRLREEYPISMGLLRDRVKAAITSIQAKAIEGEEDMYEVPEVTDAVADDLMDGTFARGNGLDRIIDLMDNNDIYIGVFYNASGVSWEWNVSSPVSNIAGGSASSRKDGLIKAINESFKLLELKLQCLQEKERL
jgi:hypothetical protein